MDQDNSRSADAPDGGAARAEEPRASGPNADMGPAENGQSEGGRARSRGRSRGRGSRGKGAAAEAAPDTAPAAEPHELSAAPLETLAAPDTGFLSPGPPPNVEALARELDAFLSANPLADETGEP